MYIESGASEAKLLIRPVWPVLQPDLLEEQAPGVKSDSALILEPFTDGLLIDIQRLLFNFWNFEVDFQYFPSCLST